VQYICSSAKFTVLVNAPPLDSAAVFTLATANLLKMSPLSGNSFAVICSFGQCHHVDSFSFHIPGRSPV